MRIAPFRIFEQIFVLEKDVQFLKNNSYEWLKCSGQKDVINKYILKYILAERKYDIWTRHSANTNPSGFGILTLYGNIQLFVETLLRNILGGTDILKFLR